MKALHWLSVLLIAALFMVGCEKDHTLAPQPEASVTEGVTTLENAEAVAMEMIALSGWSEEVEGSSPSQMDLEKSLAGGVISCERLHITGDVYHYRYRVKVGHGQYNRIGLHRVVRENRPHRPIRTAKAIFFQHGDAKDFEGMYLPGTRSPNTPDDFGIAVYLAQNNVDVWGIDQAWTLVPQGVTNFTFMANWGLQKQIDDLQIGLALARFTRAITGNGLKKMILSGYSSGVMTGIALLNQETQMPQVFRQVKGFIPIDLGFKLDDPYLRQFFEDYYYFTQSLISGGQYQEDIVFALVGYLARTDPDGDSPIFPGFTNLQAAMFFGAGQVFGEDANFHYLAGVLENGFPVGLQLVTNEQWFDFLENAVPYEPLLFEADYSALMSNAVEVPFDDHFSEIEVPIFNVAAKGGIGQLSVYGTTLVGSSDITHLIVNIGAPSILEEFGHIDIFIANNAQSLAWQPILSWIEEHTN